MNRQQQANVRAFRQLDARIAQSEADAEAGRWEQARLAYEATTVVGMTQRNYANAVGKSQSHITKLCQTWRRYGEYPGVHGIAFVDAYRMAKTSTDDVETSKELERSSHAGSTMPKASDKRAEFLAEQMMADPDVARAVVRRVMVKSSPTRRAVEHVVQASRHERKADEAAKKKDLADRSAAPFAMFLAEMGMKLSEWAGELQAGEQDVRDLVDAGYNLESLCRSAEFLAARAEVWVKIIHPELNRIPDNIIDI